LSKLGDGRELKHPKISGASVNDIFNSLKFEVDECKVNYGKVSVVMTAFNPDVELLKLSLDSIANQSYKNYEIIFIDDASNYEKKAELQALVNKYQNTRFIRNKINSGPYSGRNEALEIATGDFIAIQDADDFSHPQRFETQLKTLRANDYIKLVASQHVRIDKYGTIQFEAGFQAFGDGTMTSMFRKEVFEEVGKFLAVRSRGDVEMRERIINYYGAPAYTELDYPLVYCFADANTLSQTIARERRGALSIFREAIRNSYNRPEKTLNKPLVPISLRV
ncbi:MAG: glycosyltransferase family 2 protein, partial [Ekhidna sp.]